MSYYHQRDSQYSSSNHGQSGYYSTQPMSYSRSQDSTSSSSSSSDSQAPYQYPPSNQASQPTRYAPYNYAQRPSQPHLAPPPPSTSTRGPSNRAPISPTTTTTTSSASKPHICLHPNCTGAFARYYDLQRHMKIHFPSPSARHDCPYARPGGTCGRAGEKTPNCKGGFTREDHFIDHLRTVHGREIPKGRGEEEEWRGVWRG